MTDGMGPYLDPLEAAAAATDQTDKALGAVIAMLYQLYLEKRAIGQELEILDDEDKIGDLEQALKLIKSEESSLHRIESGLQSRLKMP